MNRYRRIMGAINYGLFLTVVALLPFPQLFLRYACVIWSVSWVLEGRWLQKPKYHVPCTKYHLPCTIYHLPCTNYCVPFLLFALWYIAHLVSGLWAADSSLWSWQMTRYLSFGVMFPAGIWGLNERYDARQIARVFVFSCIAAVPIYLGLLGTLYLHREIIDTLHWQAPWDYSCTSFLTYFAQNISHVKHRIFLCSVELLAACVAVKLYRQTPWKMVAVIVPIVIFCLLCGSRQILLTMIVLGLVMTLWELPKASRKRYGIVVGVAGLVLAGSVLCLHPRMRDFHPQTSMEMQDNAQDNFARLKIWKAALMTPGDYVAYGLGAGQSTPYLEARYQELGLDSYAQAHYHAHNQYLEVLMELGIGGLLLFLLAWLSVPFCAGEYSRKTAIVFTLLFLLNMCTERMFGMYDGIALWAVGLLFFIAIDQSAPSRAA